MRDTLINTSGMAFGGWYVIVWVNRRWRKILSLLKLSVVHVETCSLAFESVFDKVQGCLAGRRQQPVRASLRASCAARPSSPPSTRCAREELDEINVFVNVFDKVAPEKPVLANAVAVAALDKDAREELDEINVFLANVFDKAREARQGARLREAAVSSLCGQACGQAVRPGLQVRLRQGARARSLTRSTSS